MPRFLAFSSVKAANSVRKIGRCWAKPSASRSAAAKLSSGTSTVSRYLEILVREVCEGLECPQTRWQDRVVHDP